MIDKYLAVTAGGGLGALLRFVMVGALGPVFGHAAPAILCVNVAGSAVMGVLFALLVERGAAPWAPPLLMTGVLGGFTTFSAFSLDAVGLIERGRADLALAYVLGSVLLSIGALWAALIATRAVL